jgi:hypothetical protein
MKYLLQVVFASAFRYVVHVSFTIIVEPTRKEFIVH